MTIISSLLGIFAGICLYVGLLHLLIASARLKSALHFWFGLTCLLCASYILALAEALKNQLSQLQQELGDNSDAQLQSLMSL
ncbi:hypothetical protein [Nostoc sp. 'Peltigera malacea cyanobiont' DB3992]|uniref:hypothetical protein n=1 Tax=Nostoc sp. 'Peltigera malacea cyanobiont' DB3992 TaxID=1206980 RepID=UPI00117C20B2|nr:hypothetical protein [Nostoc sp. 'Peltigera malacea cyanobiont' DB3992]